MGHGEAREAGRRGHGVAEGGLGGGVLRSSKETSRVTQPSDGFHTSLRGAFTWRYCFSYLWKIVRKCGYGVYKLSISDVEVLLLVPAKND